LAGSGVRFAAKLNLRRRRRGRRRGKEITVRRHHFIQTIPILWVEAPCGIFRNIFYSQVMYNSLSNGY
jgi:hypothetical protein